VNAETLAAGVAADDVFAQQVSSADLLVLNHLDRVAASEIPKLEARLREHEPEAPIVRAEGARVDPDLLFPPDPSGLRVARRKQPTEPPAHAHEAYEAEEISLAPGLASDELRARLRVLGALRIKGFVETLEGLRVVQGIGPRIELVVAELPPPRAHWNRAVVIRRRAR
jgi:G3E family GTPase